MTPTNRRPSLSELRRLAYERAEGRSDLDGTPLVEGFELHHRRPGGKGGTRRKDHHTLSNVVCLQPWQHQNHVPGSVHDNADDWARKWGFLLPLEGPYSVPEMVPVWWRGRGWMYLPAVGGVISPEAVQREVLRRQLANGRGVILDGHPHPGGPPA